MEPAAASVLDCVLSKGITAPAAGVNRRAGQLFAQHAGAARTRQI
eukprot:SAG31_NODE_116_length_24094_cov_38.884184_6_plen_45_part_00